ncbi:hypothetical protein HY772_05065 [Candidatus Woesearchaeota archaeon]|nr:hypothetical protein [Candidatus Woesearchaeota archaeon]
MKYFDFWIEKLNGVPVSSVGHGLYPNTLGYIEPYSMQRYDILSKRIDGGIKQLQLKLKEFVDEGIPATGTELYEYFIVN